MGNDGKMMGFMDDPECFMVKSTDEKEVIEMARAHLQKVHGLRPTEKEIKAKMKMM